MKVSFDLKAKETSETSHSGFKKSTKPFKAFKSDAYGLNKSESDPEKLHFLRGTWLDGTLRHYNAGVVKLHRFAVVNKVSRGDLLPITKGVVSRFVVWASIKEEQWCVKDESVSSKTIRSYLAGIKAWHQFHNHEYPHDVTPRVNLLLRATERLEAKIRDATAKRPPVLVQDLKALLEHETAATSFGLTALAVALCAFWGTARLGDLVSDEPGKRIPLWRDLFWSEDGSFVRITILNAKTAQPGELQFIHLQKQPSRLDPVAVLENLRDSANVKPNHPLFSYAENGIRTVLTKKALMAWCEKVWSPSKSSSGKPMTGHSFRIGGASLRWNLGSSKDEVMEAGRWKSDSYKLYLRKYSPQVLRKSKQTLRDLRV